VSKPYLAVGDYLINPQLLAYAILERDTPDAQLRVGFASRVSADATELTLNGDDAKELLRWLRLNATFLTSAGGFGSIGTIKSPSAENHVQPGRRSIDRNWESLGVSGSDETARFFSQAVD
jgi:hypothetical protein